jgi:hypothetical protein
MPVLPSGGGTVDLKVPTKPVKVMISTDDYEIQGCLHIKVGSYHSRLTDLLNSKDAKFIAVTDALFLGINDPKGEPAYADTMIIRIDSIKAVLPDAEAEKKAIEEARTERNLQHPDARPKGWG